MAQVFDIAGATDRGLERPDNEDQFLVAELEKALRVLDSSLDLPRDVQLYGGSRGRCLIVADGVGGRGGGERASEVALGSIAEYTLAMLPWFFGLERSGEEQEDFEAHLKAAVARCQAALVAEAERDLSGASSRMGTTLTIAYVIWPRAFVVHVGDSRCYLLRDGAIEQLTTDQTIAQRLIEEGALDPGQAERSRFAHVLWSSMGPGGSPEPEVVWVELEPEDALVLCTDGLTTHVDDARIEKIVAYAKDSREACDLLIGEANEAGGSDNITVVVARHMERRP